MARDPRPRRIWRSAPAAALSGMLALLLAVPGVLLTGWPSLGLPTLGLSLVSLLFGWSAGRRARREALARGEPAWPATLAMVWQAFVTLVVVPLLLVGGALSAIALTQPPPTASDADRASCATACGPDEACVRRCVAFVVGVDTAPPASGVGPWSPFGGWGAWH